MRGLELVLIYAVMASGYYKINAETKQQKNKPMFALIMRYKSNEI